MRANKVPCITAAAGAPWTSFVSAVDEVLARTPPAYRIYPGTIRILPGYGFPGQIPSLTQNPSEASPLLLRGAPSHKATRDVSQQYGDRTSEYSPQSADSHPAVSAAARVHLVG